MKYGLVAVGLMVVGLKASDAPLMKRLNVVALDNHGQPVTDLHASDFQVWEDGKSKQIAYFRSAGGTVKLTTLAPGQFSNRTGISRHSTVVLVDFLSDRLMNDSVMGKDVGDTLKKLEASDDVYLYFLTNRGDVFPLHGLPEEGDETLPSTEPWTRNAAPMIDLAVKKFFGRRPVDDEDPGVRVDLTMRALDYLSGQMGHIQGRKSLIWVTHGTPLYDRPLPQLLAEKMEQQQIVVYAVQQSMRGAGASIDSLGLETLKLFTNLTGGRTYGSSSFAQAFRQAQTDSQGNYQIAYYSEAPIADRKRHKIRLVCAMKDVRLQTEQEFYALGLQLSQKDFEEGAFGNAVKSPLEGTEIGLSVNVSPVPGPGREMRFDVQLVTQDLFLLREKDHYVGKVSVVFAMDDEQATRPIPLNLNFSV